MNNKTVRIEALEDEAPPIDLATDLYAPRSRTEQQAAWAKRKRTPEDAPPPARRASSNALPIGVGAILLVAFVVALGHQFSTTPALKTSAATEAPATAAPAFQEAPSSVPEPTSTNMRVLPPTLAPIAPQNGAQQATEALQEELPQTGRGLTISSVDEAVPTPEPPPEPSYIEVVGAQAPHTIRSGATGPCDKACAVAPTISAEQAAIIGAQAPHKVR